MAETDDFYCDRVFSGEVAVEKVRETDRVLAFHHTKPSYPLHIVIVPKEHIETLVDVADFSIIEEVFVVAQAIIRELGLHETGYRIVTNGGVYQDSRHLHFHLISSEA